MASDFHFSSALGKTVIITGAANGIGAETARLFHQHGANIVIADLTSTRFTAEKLVASLGDDRALFIPTDILNWKDMTSLFQETISQFHRLDIVVANAGVIESEHLYHLDSTTSSPPADGSPREPTEHHRVIDINVKGTLNTLSLAMHHMRKQEPLPDSSSRGSILLISSTSGYFGGSGVVAYVASKHGVVGMMRASLGEAVKHQVRINCVAPYMTPTHMTSAFAEEWGKRGLPANTTLDVATAVARMALDESLQGNTILAAGRQTKEIEATRTALIPTWLGASMSDFLTSGMSFFNSFSGGYPLPAKRN